MARSGTQLLDHVGARAIAARCFEPTSTRDLVGLELEWHVFDAHDLDRRPGVGEIRAAVGVAPLAPGVTTSIEPGGQIELDTPPRRLPQAVALARQAAAELRRRLDAAHLVPSATGCDPHRRPENLLDEPRYEAMATTFAVRGPHGIAMMANTAAVQVNVDLSLDHGRWVLAHQLGPVLVAAFANSPVAPDRSTGRKCHRLANWWAIDPSRTAPVDHCGDPADAWYHYAMQANLLLIRREGRAVPMHAPFTFETWMAEGHELGRPTADDFCYHLTTLFPPVRPRGFLELRFLDALDDRDWIVATAVIAGLGHDDCRREALALTEPATGRWMAAATDGLDDPVLAAVADAIAPLALDGLAALGADGEITRAVRAWQDGDLAARRCPADRLLDRWHRTGSLVPLPQPASP